MKNKVSDPFGALDNVRGTIIPPLILWLLGAPITVAIIVWLLFFRA